MYLLSRVSVLNCTSLLSVALLMVGDCCAGGSTSESLALKHLCDSLERRDTLGLISTAAAGDCEQINRIVHDYIGLPENNRAMHGEGTFSQVAAEHAPFLLHQVLCVNHCELSMFLANLLLSGDPLISEMHGELKRIVLDRNVPSVVWSPALDLAISVPDANRAWLLHLLYPEQNEVALRKIFSLFENDHDLLRQALPKIVLVSQASPNRHSRRAAAAFLNIHKDHLDPELLIKLLLVASEGCHPSFRDLLEATDMRFNDSDVQEAIETMCEFQ